MKRMKAVSVVLGILAVCVALMIAGGLSAQVGDQKASEPDKLKAGEQEIGQKASAGKDGVIGYLESRDKIVTLLQGPKGTLYTVKTKDGKTLAAKLSEKDFQTKYPALHDQVKHGLAGNDATLRKPSERPIEPVDVPAR